MFQNDFNCKKCPSTEQTTVCNSGKEAGEKLVQKQNVQENQSVNAATNVTASLFTGSAGESSTSKFFARTGDDRSTLSSHNVHPIAKFALLALMVMHSLSETPGLGSNGPSLSQFVISNHELAGQKGGLKLS